MVDEELTAAQRLFLDDVAGLALGADEEDTPATCGGGAYFVEG